MKLNFVAAALAALAVVAHATPSAAQASKEECLGLEARLAALGRPKTVDPRSLQQAAASQQSELDRTVAYSKGIGCGRRFIFAPDPPAECGPLGERIANMQINLDRLKAQAAQAAQGGGVDPRRRELLFALARGQCGPQYRLVERKVVTQQPSGGERKGLFGFLFGGGASEQRQHEETVIEPEVVSPDGGAPRVSTFRTVCVRTCDGFFFPVSYQTTRNAFGRDEAICQATCPGSEAKLFAYANPGGVIDNATAVDGQPYNKLENAFRYRKEFVAGCSCKPEGMSWAEALQGVDDKTVKKGDIVVDEQKSMELSRPKTEQELKAQAQAPARSRPRPPAASDTDARDLPPMEQGEPRATGAPARATRTIPDDVIILDQPRFERGRIERRPIDDGAGGPEN